MEVRKLAILDDLKNELRISGTDFDSEITALINAAKTDLEQSGVVKVVDTDYLTKMAIVLYCKGNFGYDNTEAERYLGEYEKLRAKLSVASDYNQFKVTFTIYALTTATPLKEAVISIDDANATELVTNSLGVAYYYSYVKELDFDYAVAASGYSTVESSVYVDNDETVSVVMT